MKPYNKKDKTREIIHALMECSSETELINLMNECSDFDKDQDMIVRFANRLTHIENLQDIKQKIHLKAWNIKLN